MNYVPILSISVGFLVLAATTQKAQALIDFNPPTYTESDLTFPDAVYPVLDGQDGWDNAFDWQFLNAVVSEDRLLNDMGIDLSVGNGGPGIDGYAGGNVHTGGVLFAARAATTGYSPIVNGNSLVADFLSHDFDNDDSNNSAIRLFGWIDVNEDGHLTNLSGDVDKELTMGFGLDDTGQFALRETRTNGPSSGEIQSGVNYLPDKWYTITLRWSDPQPDGSRDVTMHVYNKTDNVDVGNVFDNYNVSESFFGPDPSLYDGFAVRWTEGLMDNIQEGLFGGLDGDLNGDGFVGLDDLDIILGTWNQTVPPADEAADPSGDGFVGLDDLDIVLNNWNAGTPPIGAVPEPVSLTILGLGLCSYLRRYPVGR